MAKKPTPETNAEKFTRFIDGLVENHTISADVAGIIKHAIAAKQDQLEK